MVYITLPEIIKDLQNKITQRGGLELSLYLYCSGKKQIQNIDDFVYEDEKIAFAGYASLSIDKERVEKLLNEKPVKGISFRTNIFKLIGVYLKASKFNLQGLDSLFPHLEYKLRFIISKLFYKDYDQLIKALSSENSYDDVYKNLLAYLLLENHNINIDLLSTFLQKEDLDAIDLVILENVMLKALSVKYMNFNSIDLIIKVLKSFSNSIKRVTSDRYNKRLGIEINDEYDVQDILFSLLKGIFNDLQRENPLSKQAGVSSRIDMNIPSEGIMIEVKMIKYTDKDHKKYIKELKEDIVNYSSWNDLQHLVLFIYDPYNKTTDDNDFYDLENVLADSRMFTIHSILVK